MTVISSFLPVKTRPFPKFHYNLELGGVSFGYVISTSEPADSQVSTPSLLTFTKDRSQYSLTFTKDEYHQILKLGGVSSGYVIATSEPADS